MFDDVIALLLKHKENVEKERAELDAKEAKIDKMLVDVGYVPPIAEVATIEANSVVEPAPVVEQPATGGILYGCNIYE
jgi:hypothetical protein